MSKTARWVLGSFALLFAVAFAVAVQNSPEPLFLWCCAGFCLLIALACFSTVVRTPVVRIIGAVVFSLYAFYVFQELTRISRVTADRNLHWYSLAALHGPIEGLITFGLPGVYFAIRGRLPRWSEFTPAFRGSRERPKPKGVVITR